MERTDSLVQNPTVSILSLVAPSSTSEWFVQGLQRLVARYPRVIESAVRNAEDFPLETSLRFELAVIGDPGSNLPVTAVRDLISQRPTPRVIILAFSHSNRVVAEFEHAAVYCIAFGGNFDETLGMWFVASFIEKYILERSVEIAFRSVTLALTVDGHSVLNPEKKRRRPYKNRCIEIPSTKVCKDPVLLDISLIERHPEFQKLTRNGMIKAMRHLLNSHWPSFQLECDYAPFDLIRHHSMRISTVEQFIAGFRQALGQL